MLRLHLLRRHCSAARLAATATFATVLAWHAADAQEVAASSQVLWVQPDGSVLASGDAGPERGDDDDYGRNFFAPIEGLPPARSVAIALEGRGAGAIDQDGNVWLWGDDWCEAFEGAADCETESHRPRRLPTLEDARSIALASGRVAALTNDGQVVGFGPTWNGNEYGQLGNGTIGPIAEPVRPSGFEDAKALAINDSVTLIVRQDGTVWGVGNGWGGLLGPGAKAPGLLDYPDGDNASNPTPIRVRGLEKIETIALGVNFAAALDRDGKVWGWGINDSGQLGYPAIDLAVLPPRQLRGLERIVSIAAGYDFLIALREDGKVLAMGGNVYGALGDLGGELEGRLRTIGGLSGVEAIYAGHYNAFARLENGSFVGWGANDPSVGGFHARAIRGSLEPISIDPALRPEPPSALVAAGGAALSLYNELWDDQTEESVEVYFGDALVGTSEVTRRRPQHEVRIELSRGLHPYRLQGSTRMDDGRFEINGSGILVVSDQSLEERLLEAAADGTLITTMQGLFSDLDEVSSGIIPESLRLWSDGPLSAERLDALEANLGFSLPPSYRSALSEVGPFGLGDRDALLPAAALRLPRSDASLAGWARRLVSLSEPEDETSFEYDAYWTTNELPELIGKNDWRALLEQWTRYPTGAFSATDVYFLRPDGDCGGPTAASWVDFLDIGFDDDGLEEYLPWRNEIQCDVELLDSLVQNMLLWLEPLLNEAGVVIVVPDPRGERVPLFFERDEPSGRLLPLRIMNG